MWPPCRYLYLHFSRPLHVNTMSNKKRHVNKLHRQKHVATNTSASGMSSPPNGKFNFPKISTAKLHSIRKKHGENMPGNKAVNKCTLIEVRLSIKWSTRASVRSSHPDNPTNNLRGEGGAVIQHGAMRRVAFSDASQSCQPPQSSF